MRSVPNVGLKFISKIVDISLSEVACVQEPKFQGVLPILVICMHPTRASCHLKMKLGQVIFSPGFLMQMGLRTFRP